VLTLHLTFGLLAVLIFLAGRLSLPRQPLLVDTVFLGLLIFFVGAWVGTYQSFESPQAEAVLRLAVISLVSGALAVCLLAPVYRGIPSVLAGPQPLRTDFVVATTVFLVVSNLLFSFLVFKLLMGGSLTMLADEKALLGVRKLIATGQRGYFFPGLVKQIRDVLAPAFVFYLIAYSPPRTNRLAILAVVSTTLVAIGFGGQRMPILILAFAIFLALRARRTTWPAPGRRRWSPLRQTALVVLCVVLYSGLNGLLGRGDLDGSALAIIGDTAHSIFERTVLTVPVANIEAFHFVTHLDFGVGALWLADVAGLVPGTQVAFSNEIHSYLGGSFDGNAVLGLPVSAFVNAGYPGVILAPIAAIVGAALFDRRVASLNSPMVTSVRCACLAYLPVCYDPAIFLLDGGLMLLFVIGWVTLFTLRRERQVVFA